MHIIINKILRDAAAIIQVKKITNYKLNLTTSNNLI